jgi:hypothetical protein
MPPTWIISSVLAAVGLGWRFPTALVSFPQPCIRIPKTAMDRHLEKVVALFLAGTSLFAVHTALSRLIPALACSVRGVAG